MTDQDQLTAVLTPGVDQTEKVLILDFGGQYKQLIGRRVREHHVYCEIRPCTLTLAQIQEGAYKAIILTGGPRSVYETDVPSADPGLLELGIPVLGICYGAQWIAHTLGGRVTPAPQREYGKATLHATDAPLFRDVPADSTVWMSHNDYIETLPADFITTASTDACPNAAFQSKDGRIVATQFHPEVEHTEHGTTILRNFLFEVAGLKPAWHLDRFIEQSIETIRTQVGDGKVLSAFSGGVDSSVASLLVHKAVGDQLTCIFVDHGLLRKDEGDQVEEVFAKNFHMNIIRVNAQERFLSKLAGVTDPEQKRKIIGEEFIRVFEEEAKKLGHVDYLVQGTIYPDVIESGVEGAVIKSHHNVGGLPKDIGFTGLIEPLRDLFKDEVRAVGTELGIPDDLVWRQPFPGPGLGVRILGGITADRVAILQEADHIFRTEIALANLDRTLSQYFAVLTDMRSVGVMGDARTYDYTLGLRAVITNDFMTAEWARIPYDVLERVSNRIINEVPHINRVVYDITGKPPATIEWE